MTLAIFRAMLLSLLRDPGALVMSFAMPVAFFVIFAEIFANAAGGEFALRVAVVDEVKSAESDRLLAAVRRDPAVHGLVTGEKPRRTCSTPCGAGMRTPASWSAPTANRSARRAASGRHRSSSTRILRARSPGPCSPAGCNRPTRLRCRSCWWAASSISWRTSSPNSMSASATTSARGSTTSSASAMKGQAPAWSLADLIEEQSVAGRPAASNHVAYYAGAIAFMFLLLSAAQGALVLFDERDNGVLDRIVAGPGGVGVSVNGKFLYLTAQGLAQTAVIFAVAWARYGVDVAAAPGRWLADRLCSPPPPRPASVSLLVTACRSRAQAQTLSTAAILVMSAVGGSMVPRFFMPGWLQNVGWLTPNTWVLEVYSGILWRNESLAQLAFPCAMLALVSVATFLAVHILARRMVRG